MKNILNKLIISFFKLISILASFVGKIINNVENYSNRVVNQINNNIVDLYHITFDSDLRSKTFHMSNNSLLEGKEMFRALYNTLFTNKEFLSFGSTKIIILFAINPNGTQFTVHHNILVNNYTSFDTYYSIIRDKLEYFYDSDEYELNIHTLLDMHVWDMSHLSNKDIKVSSRALNKRMFSTSARQLGSFKSPIIAPIPVDNHETTGTPVGAIDLETINILSGTGQGVQETVCISFYNKELGSKLFLIDYNLLEANSQEAISKLWKEFFIYLEEVIIIEHPLITIFAHNLGSFDGYFLYKQLSLFVENNPISELEEGIMRMNSDISCLLDKQKKFITIKYRGITFKDSYRLFPVSLANLCKITGTKGKIEAYNAVYNEIAFFKDAGLIESFISYARQDSKALYDALIKLQNIYLEKYKVNLTTVFSTSTLSLKIFRTNFQKEIIPILSKGEDSFIRPSYFGGATDYYKAYGENLYYYDVTSLYPFAMCKPLPGKLVKIHKTNEEIKLDNFFGFINCEITIDSNVLKPMVPFKHKGKTIFPTGTLSGVYFSEEIKAFNKLDGYKIKLLNGYEFEKVYYFNEYIQDFFNQKKVSLGAERFIAKMHLNQLYGYFGRSYDVINTININSLELKKLLTHKLLKTFIKLANNLHVVLIEGNTSAKIVDTLNLGASFKN
jgi:hypothetical protein